MQTLGLNRSYYAPRRTRTRTASTALDVHDRAPAVIFR
jgi:hypothetical protein